MKRLLIFLMVVGCTAACSHAFAYMKFNTDIISKDKAIQEIHMAKKLIDLKPPRCSILVADYFDALDQGNDDVVPPCRCFKACGQLFEEELCLDLTDACTREKQDGLMDMDHDSTNGDCYEDDGGEDGIDGQSGYDLIHGGGEGDYKTSKEKAGEVAMDSLDDAEVEREEFEPEELGRNTSVRGVSIEEDDRGDDLEEEIDDFFKGLLGE